MYYQYISSQELEQITLILSTSGGFWSTTKLHQFLTAGVVPYSIVALALCQTIFPSITSTADTTSKLPLPTSSTVSLPFEGVQAIKICQPHVLLRSSSTRHENVVCETLFGYPRHEPHPLISPRVQNPGLGIIAGVAPPPGIGHERYNSLSPTTSVLILRRELPPTPVPVYARQCILSFSSIPLRRTSHLADAYGVKLLLSVRTP